jgi:polar amino acid transport system permease protein
MIDLWNDLVNYRAELIDGLWTSVRLALLTFTIGLPAGLVLAVASQSRRKGTRVLAVTLVEIGRGTPALVMLQLVYYGIPITLSGFLSAAIALALTTAAYTSEIIRGGLQAVPRQEIEAGHALGFKDFQILRDIVIPQGLRMAIPPLLGFCIMMFQATSLAFTIAVPELMAQARSISNINFHYFNIFVIAGLLYALITIPSSVMTDRLERKLALHLQHTTT